MGYLDTNKQEQALKKQRLLDSDDEIRLTLRERLKNKLKRPTSVKKTTFDLLPYTGVIGTENFIVSKGRFMEIFQLQGYNLDAMGDHLERVLHAYDELNRLYVYPFKVVTIYTPLDTMAQQRYYLNLAQQTDNPLYKKELMTSYYEMKYFSEHELNKEFFIFIYADTLEEIRECREDFLRYSGVLKILSIPYRKKKAVLFKLNNPMLKVLLED
ncbi:MAG: hypothetical protein Q4B80_01775 [Aerococcaceae bacterium]|nr:hypothetical protein [Aerococcaceae bacterium]